uniref:Bromo domain-containing protein n=1 Tax=Heterorhabditis bacteriophora TaxID=37862 RepID=A0A1I7WSA8_HETBA
MEYSGRDPGENGENMENNNYIELKGLSSSLRFMAYSLEMGSYGAVGVTEDQLIEGKRTGATRFINKACHKTANDSPKVLRINCDSRANKIIIPEYFLAEDVVIKRTVTQHIFIAMTDDERVERRSMVGAPPTSARRVSSLKISRSTPRSAAKFGKRKKDDESEDDSSSDKHENESEAGDQIEEDSGDDHDGNEVPGRPKRKATAMEEAHGGEETAVEVKSPTPPPVQESPEPVIKTPSIGKYSPLQLMCDHILRKVMSKDPEEYFAFPVTPAMAPDYHTIISQPMDFSKIRYIISPQLAFPLLHGITFRNSTSDTYFILYHLQIRLVIVFHNNIIIQDWIINETENFGIAYKKNIIRLSGQSTISYLNYGPFCSFAPQYDSTWATLTKRDSDLLLRTYGDRSTVSDVMSLRNMVTDAGAHFIKVVDDLLDTLTDGEHSRTIQCLENKNDKVEPKENVEDIAELINELESLENLGVDVGFLEDVRLKLGLAKPTDLQAQLDANGRAVLDLARMQHQRLSQPPPITLTKVAQPSLLETQLAANVQQQLANQVAMHAQPNQIVTAPAIHDAIGIHDEFDMDILGEFFVT